MSVSSPVTRSRASRTGAEPESSSERFLSVVRSLERARRRRAFAARLAGALPLSAAGAAAAVFLFDQGLAPVAIRSALEAPLEGMPPLFLFMIVAAAATGALLAAALVARVGSPGDPSLRRVAADVDRGLGLSDRAASAVDVLESARPAPGSMGGLVVADALRRIPDGAGRTLFPAPPIGKAVFISLGILLVALLPRALRLPTVERFLRFADRADAGAPDEAEDPTLTILAIDPDRGFSGSTVTVTVEGLAAGPVAVRFGLSDARVTSSVGGSIEVVVPDGLPLGVVPVVVRQARTRSPSLPFLVLPAPPGESGGEDEEDEEEPEPQPEEPPSAESGAPPPPPAGPDPDLPDEDPPPPAAPKKTTRRFVVPLESEDGEKRVKEAFVLEADPEESPATQSLPDGAAGEGAGRETPFRKAQEDAVRRPDLDPADREVVRRYFEKLAPSAEREKR